MKSIFKATAILSGSSLINIVLSLVSAKVLALYLKPTGYGYYGLLQSFVAVASLVAGLGTATGLVRLGAAAAGRDDQVELAALRTAAWVVYVILGGLLMLVLIVFRVEVSRWATGSPDHTTAIVWMGVAILFTVAGSIQTGILNSYHRVGDLAKSAVLNTIIGVTFSITAVLTLHLRGVVPAVLGGGIAGWLASGYFLKRELGPTKVRPRYPDVRRALGALLKFGTPYTGSMLIGTGVQLALPMVVVHLLSTESVGYYRAAVAISVGYLGFLMTAMGQDYYPRLSAAGDEPGVLVKLINEQHRLVMIVAVPIILGTLALVPFLIPIVYSHKFQPAVDILEWQLIGDVFKFSSLTMSFAILARFGSLTYFLTELIGGGVTLGTTWLAVRWYGLQGLGISFLITYMVYYFVVWAIVRRRVPLVWTSSNKRMMVMSVVAALIVRSMPATRFAGYRTPVALTLAVATGISSLLIIRRELFSRSGSSPVRTLGTEAGNTSAVV